MQNVKGVVARLQAWGWDGECFEELKKWQLCFTSLPVTRHSCSKDALKLSSSVCWGDVVMIPHQSIIVIDDFSWKCSQCLIEIALIYECTDRLKIYFLFAPNFFISISGALKGAQKFQNWNLNKSQQKFQFLLKFTVNFNMHWNK